MRDQRGSVVTTFALGLTAIHRSLRHRPEEVAAQVHAKPGKESSHGNAQLDLALVPGRVSVRWQTQATSSACETIGSVAIDDSVADGRELDLDPHSRYATTRRPMVRCRTDATVRIT